MMSNHSIAEAKKRLSELIDRALEGEGVTITRRGRPVVELRPVARRVSAEDLEWLAARRVGRKKARTDAGTLVSAMRDEAEV